MASLTAQQKRFIVQRLATFETPTEVVRAFSEEWPGVGIDRRQVGNYDGASKYSRQRMAKALVELFDETRERFRTETDDIAIANKAYRLKRLDGIVRDTRSPKLQMEAMEQAAKECGDAYTNRRVLEGDPERPLQLRVALEELEELTPEEKVALYRETIRGEAKGDRS